MRVAFTHLPVAGHVNPTLALTRELVGRGAEVVAFASGPVVDDLTAAGARCLLYDPQVDAIRERSVDASLIRVAGVLAEATEIALGPLLERLAALAPDVVVHDSMAPWGRLAAERLGLPAVCSTSTLVVHPAINPGARVLAAMAADAARNLPEIARFQRRRRRIARRWGARLGPPPDMFANRGGASSVLAYTSREFQPGAARMRDPIEYVGPLLGGAPALTGELAERIGDGPLVYVSLGTLFNRHPAFLRSCLAGLASHPGPVLVSIGHQLDPADLGPVPGNAILAASVPQVAVLERAAAFITHAGMNSAMEALWHGVPMVCAPQAAEQPIIARRLVRLGAGERPRALDPAAIAAAVGRVLTGPHRARARELGAGLRACGGAEAAADAVIAAAASPRPR